jgi:hypothetical protein
MATKAKKSPAKKAPAKKVARKAAPRKKPVARKATRSAASRFVSFRATTDNESFFDVRFNIQTVYWLIISVLVVALTIWVLVLQMRIIDIYDTIQANNQLDDAGLVVNPHDK